MGAYLSGNPTLAHTWCPTGTVGNARSMAFYPQSDSLDVETDVLAATTDGQHILGAAMVGGGVTLSDIGVTIPSSVTSPSGDCVVTTTGSGSRQVQTLSPLTIAHTLNQVPLTKVNATAVNQVVASPASNLAFITYTGTSPGALLPYYLPGSGGAPGTVGYVTLGGSSASAITAPIAGAFSPDNTLFFVSTSGDNEIHYIDVQTLTDTQQISPNLPACVPGSDPACTLTTPDSNPVPATAILVKPRSTT